MGWWVDKGPSKAFNPFSFLPAYHLPTPPTHPLSSPQGTYGVVFKAINSRTKEMVALKQVSLSSLFPPFPLGHISSNHPPTHLGQTPLRNSSKGRLLSQRPT